MHLPSRPPLLPSSRPPPSLPPSPSSSFSFRPPQVAARLGSDGPVCAAISHLLHRAGHSITHALHAYAGAWAWAWAQAQDARMKAQKGGEDGHASAGLDGQCSVLSSRQACHAGRRANGCAYGQCTASAALQLPRASHLSRRERTADCLCRRTTTLRCPASLARASLRAGMQGAGGPPSARGPKPGQGQGQHMRIIRTGTPSSPSPPLRPAPSSALPSPAGTASRPPLPSPFPPLPFQSCVSPLPFPRVCIPPVPSPFPSRPRLVC